LRLHDEDRTVQLRGPFLRREGRFDFLAARHRHAELREQLLGLKFMDVHRAPLS
jgi:hypothetical protein